MKKLNLILLTLIASTSCLFGQSWEWAKSFPSDANNSIHSIEESLDGDVFISGILQETTVFGNDTIFINGLNTLGYVAKMTSDGTAIWAKSIFIHNGTTQSFAFPIYISVTSDNSIILSGQFKDSLIIGSDTLYDSNGQLFISQLDSEGNIQWALNFGDSTPLGTNVVQLSENHLDDEDNIYLTGTFHDTAYFQTNTLYWEDGEIFIVKFDKYGNEKWVRQCGKGGGWQRGYDITTDDFKNVYITGVISSGESQFGSTIIETPNSRNNTYITKLDSLGSFQWAKTGGGTTDFIGAGQIIPSTYGTSIHTDGTDNVYFSGFFADTVLFGNSFFYPTCGDVYCLNFFLASYDLEGNFNWFVQTSSETRSSAGDLEVDDEGNIYITGLFKNEIDFNGLSVTSTVPTNYRDNFIAKFNSLGECIGIISQDTRTNGGRISVSCLNQSIYLGGSYRDFAGNLESLGLEDSPNQRIFVAAISNSFECEEITKTDEVKNETLFVYPNPTTSWIQIRLPKEYATANVSLRDISNRKILEKTIENEGQVDLSALADGVYLLVVCVGEKVWVERVLRVGGVGG